MTLSEFADSFTENGIDAAMLPELNNQDLKDLSILRIADRKHLLKIIAKLEHIRV